MANSELEKQIAQEAQEIANAPHVDPLPPVGRCAWCGRLSHDLALVEVTHGMERYKCHVCQGLSYE